MDMPGLRTRAGNKLVRPGKLAGLAKKVRGSREDQLKAKHDKEAKKAATDAKTVAKLKQAAAKVAAIEDKQHTEDVDYAESANHPPGRRVSQSVAPEEPQDKEDLDVGLSVGPPETDGAGFSGSGDDSSGYKDGEESSSEDSESQSEDEPKRKKKASASRADVHAARLTQDSTGTPADVAGTSRKRKAAEKYKKNHKKSKTSSGKTGVTVNKKSGFTKPHVKTGKRGAAAEPEDDSMVAMCGPTLDDDAQEEIERPKKGKKAMGVPAKTLSPQRRCAV
ncbi:hypothetical protein B0H10DRAFT_1967645 [Mycena sp. CBHHK59/15]|nr:hypothetical protein B0H10DRAFT_1967645 [Mycena sp. CBHHK59/15]